MSDPTPGGDAAVVTSALLHDWPLPTPGEAGKDARGSVVVIGGAAATPGAVLLAGVAALRAGAGRLTMATVERNAAALAVTVPEAGVTPLPATPEGSLGADAASAAGNLLERADAVVLGPGMSGPDATKEFVAALLPKLGEDSTLVLDALALTCGGLDRDDCRRLGGRVVITPNPSEVEYLIDDVPDSDELTARQLASQWGAVVALRSTVAAPDGRMWRDGSGNAGLGTSGSGDVLAGVVAGLAARGASPEQAAVWAVHLHAEAGERLAARIGALGYLARELLDEVPLVLSQLSGAALG